MIFLTKKKRILLEEAYNNARHPYQNINSDPSRICIHYTKVVEIYFSVSRLEFHWSILSQLRSYKRSYSSCSLIKKKRKKSIKEKVARGNVEVMHSVLGKTIVSTIAHSIIPTPPTRKHNELTLHLPVQANLP